MASLKRQSNNLLDAATTAGLMAGIEKFYFQHQVQIEQLGYSAGADFISDNVTSKVLAMLGPKMTVSPEHFRVLISGLLYALAVKYRPTGLKRDFTMSLMLQMAASAGSSYVAAPYIARIVG